jgi:hypothetical protein
MKNLKQLTAELNLFQCNDIPAPWKQKQVLNGSTFDYSDKVNNEYTLPSELLNKYEHGLFWECRKQYKNEAPTEVELYYIEHSRILFLSPNGNLLRLTKDRNKKYTFGLDWSHYREVQNISHYSRETAIKESGIVEPNYIGVFTDKKILDWFNYCDAMAEINKQLVLDSADKNTEIEKEIQSFIDSVKCQVQRWDNKTDVTTDFFQVRFTHDKASQYLSKVVTFTGTLKDITNLTNKK